MFKLNVAARAVKPPPAAQLTSRSNRAVMERMAGLRLIDLAADAWELDVKNFSTHHGSAFLLRKGVPPTTAEMEEIKRTALVGRAPLRPGTLPGADFLVYALRSPPVSIGRSRKNHIVIADPSISTTHAVFLEIEKEWHVVDAGSSNGTFVEDEPAPAKASGESVAVDTGARVRLGAVNLTFLDALELIRLIKRLIPRPQVSGS